MIRHASLAQDLKTTNAPRATIPTSEYSTQTPISASAIQGTSKWTPTLSFVRNVQITVPLARPVVVAAAVTLIIREAEAAARAVMDTLILEPRFVRNATTLAKLAIPMIHARLVMGPETGLLLKEPAFAKATSTIMESLQPVFLACRLVKLAMMGMAAIHAELQIIESC